LGPDRPILRVEDLHAHYGPSHVLHGFTLDLPPGQVTAIVGPNGVGKTTLINAIVGLVPATGGRIVYDGVDLTTLPASARRRFGIALVPQGRRVFRSLTVDEHLTLVGRSSADRFDRAWIFETFPRLSERRRALAGTLSGGEQSMLAIARALTIDPRLLLMDEPTEGLAPMLIETVSGVVRQLRDLELTIVLVEQRLGFALAVADRVAVMHRGTIERVEDRPALSDVASLSELILGKRP
jgi:branched-chain amino acid transport system ATP-binding protein